MGKYVKPPLSSDLICHYCEIEQAVGWDHIVPYAVRGSHEQYNLVPACEECNTNKRAVWPECTCPICRNAVEMFISRPNMLDYAEYQTKRLIFMNGGKPYYRESLARIQAEQARLTRERSSDSLIS